RELLQPLGDIDLREVDRAQLVERIDAVRADGRPGAAEYLRAKLTPFLNWTVNVGIIDANVLAGWRKPRASRAEKLSAAAPGRALDDKELSAFWRAAEAAGFPFGPYLKLLLLCGQRRTETALMAWSQVDLACGRWVIPPEINKVGRKLVIPLPP